MKEGAIQPTSATQFGNINAKMARVYQIIFFVMRSQTVLPVWMRMMSFVVIESVGICLLRVAMANVYIKVYNVTVIMTALTVLTKYVAVIVKIKLV